MPEPVVIIGPANRPATPIGEPAEDAPPATPADSDTEPQREQPKRKKSTFIPMLAHLAVALLSLLARGLKIFAAVGMSIVQQYPRHSLAAGASVVILSAIWYSQAGARRPVATQIPAGSTATQPKEAKNAPAAKTGENTVSPGNVASKNSGDTGGPKPDAKLPAPATASSSKEKSDATAAPTIVAKNDEAPSLSPPATAPPADLPPEPKPEPAPQAAPALEQAKPTLLAAAAPEPAPPLPSPGGNDGKEGGTVAKSPPAIEAPAPIAAQSPSPVALPELPPAPAPAGGPTQPAEKGEDPTKLTKETPPKPLTEGPPGEAQQHAEPKPAPKSSDAPGPDSGSPANSLLSQPEPATKDAIISENRTQEPGKSDGPPPVTLGSAAAPEPEPAMAPTLAAPSPGGEAAGAAKPPLENSTARIESPPREPSAPGEASLPGVVPAASTTAASILESHVPAPDAKAQPRERDANEAENPQQQAALPPSAPETRGARTKRSQPDARPRALPDEASEGWVSVPNGGKIPFDDESDADTKRDDLNADVLASPRAVRGHAAKNIDFELESQRSAGAPQLEPSGRRSVTNASGSAGAAPGARSRPATGRVEPSAHVVEPLENFWTISRLYYSSGRYYRALWKANAAKYPKIDRLKVNDVILIPAVEDLDPEYIDPPREPAPAAFATARGAGGRFRRSREGDADTPAESAAVSSGAGDGVSLSTTRTSRGSDGAVPVHRSSRTDPDLDLPAPEAVSQRDNKPDRTGRRMNRPLGADDDFANDEPETRAAARPRATTAASKMQKTYKVRPNDTVRSIARDMLGDSHRADEILDLNSGLIDDPAHLTVGQLLQLPDDARTSVRHTSRPR